MADKSCWSQLPLDLYRLILSKLQSKDIIRFDAACGWSRAVVKSIFTCLAGPPRLLCSASDQERFRFYSLKAPCSRTFFSNLKGNFLKGLGHGDCVGSSQGYLIFYMRYKAPLVLVNPFSGDQLGLPPVCNFPDLAPRESPNLHKFVVLLQQRPPRSSSYYCSTCIGVLVLFHTSDTYFSYKNTLAFSRVADDDHNKWTRLNPQEGSFYADAMTYDQSTFYALRVCPELKCTKVEIWDFPDSSLLPIKRIEIQAYYHRAWSIFIPRHFIVKTRQDLLLVVMEYTPLFKVFKLKDYSPSISSCSTFDYKWIEVKSIGNHVHALVLGDENETIIISKRDDAPHFQENSIYYSTSHVGVYDLGKKQATILWDLPKKRRVCGPLLIWVDLHPVYR